MNPKDKQNVGLATEFLYTLSHGLKCPSLPNISIRVASNEEDLRHLSIIIDGILCLYSYVTLSIEEQLQYVSKAAFTLLLLYRKLKGNLIPSQLYHDLQSTFENVYFCSSKFQVHHPDSPIFLFLLGTDALERLFGNMRQKSKSSFDCLDMINICRAMTECSKVLDSHPEWVASSSKLMSRICLDYSKPSNWDKSKLTLASVNIPAMWEIGRHHTETAFLGKSDCDFFQMMSSNVTLLKPFGNRKVGVREIITDYSQVDVNETEVVNAMDTHLPNSEQPGFSANESVSISTSDISSIVDYVEEPSGTKYDNQIQIEGEYFFKASVVRQLFDQSSASSDRLKRVQAMGKYMDEGKSDMNLDNIVMLGDPILHKISVAVIKDIIVAGKKRRFCKVKSFMMPTFPWSSKILTLCCMTLICLFGMVSIKETSLLFLVLNAI